MAEPARSQDDSVVIWEPRSKPQAAFIACPVFEIFFGGSRGSLKTDSALGDWINHSSLYGEHAAGLMVRRTREQLSATKERAKQMLTPLGFKFTKSDNECRGPNGSLLTFAYLQRDEDAENYQGWNLTRVYVEEIGNFPNPAPVLKLMATLRSAHGVPVGFRATGNPGGPGHQWVKARYVTADPKGWHIQKFSYENPWTGESVTKDRIFIPGKITDHNLLGPDYIAQLQMSGSKELVRAWLEGDWDVVLGAYFDCWSSEKHVIRPFPLKPHWLRFRSFDWGSAAPFSCGWWAVPSEAVAHPDGFTIPKGAMVRFREWYGAKRDDNGHTIPNEGLKLTAEEVAHGIKQREAKDPKVNEFGHKVSYGVADPSMFRQDGGPSIAERMAKVCGSWRPADNTRVAEIGHAVGWDGMRQRLIGDGDGRPMIYTFDTCLDSIRTIPALQHDEAKPEDVDTDGEDHAGDDWRYACASRPWIRNAPDPEKPIVGTEGLTLNRLWDQQKRRKRNRR